MIGKRKNSLSIDSIDPNQNASQSLRLFLGNIEPHMDEI